MVFPSLMKFLFLFSLACKHICHRFNCFPRDIPSQIWWRWNVSSDLMGLTSLAWNCRNCDGMLSRHIYHRSIKATLQEQVKPNNNVKWRTKRVYFEDSIFNGSSKIQWQEKSFHHMEGHFFHRFKWDILQRHNNTDCIALTDRYRFCWQASTLSLKSKTRPDSLMTNLQAYT